MKRLIPHGCKHCGNALVWDMMDEQYTCFACSRPAYDSDLAAQREYERQERQRLAWESAEEPAVPVVPVPVAPRKKKRRTDAYAHARETIPNGWVSIVEVAQDNHLTVETINWRAQDAGVEVRRHEGLRIIRRRDIPKTLERRHGRKQRYGPVDVGEDRITLMEVARLLGITRPAVTNRARRRGIAYERFGGTHCGVASIARADLDLLR